MKEYLDVLDIDGIKTGEVKLRDEIHKDGDWHQSIHVWLIKEKELLVQKRSTKKESYPGCYDATVAGHVISGEDILEAAKRECEEEIGVLFQNKEFIELDILRLCIEHNNRGFISNEFNHIIVVEVKNNPRIVIDNNEIEEIKWMKIEFVYDEIMRGNNRFCISSEEIQLILRYIGGKDESSGR